MLNVIQQYSDQITSWRVLLYEQDGKYARLKLEIVFHDGSKLHVKDYHFAPDERKYAFHWSDSNGKLKIRWDNAQHWRNIPTFPHHKHVGHDKNVEVSAEVTLAEGRRRGTHRTLVLEYLKLPTLPTLWRSPLGRGRGGWKGILTPTLLVNDGR